MSGKVITSIGKIPNVSFSTKGQLALSNTARFLTFDQIPAVSLKAPGVSPATFVALGLDGAFQFADNQDQTVSFAWAIPRNLDRTYVPMMRLGWSSPSNTGNCYWKTELLWLSEDGDTTNTTPDVSPTAIDAVSTTANGYKFSALTLNTPSTTDRIAQIRVQRLGSDVLDTVGDAVDLLGVLIEYACVGLGGAV